uniref:Uncharacterized protein n=1 Tax=Salarias fasciatus TaxID=181472 RepID=A0A672IZM9_SALFA
MLLRGVSMADICICTHANKIPVRIPLWSPFGCQGDGSRLQLGEMVKTLFLSTCFFKVEYQRFLMQLSVLQTETGQPDGVTRLDE